MLSVQAKTTLFAYGILMLSFLIPLKEDRNLSKKIALIVIMLIPISLAVYTVNCLVTGSKGKFGLGCNTLAWMNSLSILVTGVLILLSNMSGGNSIEEKFFNSGSANSGSDGVRFDLFSQNNTVQNSTFNNLGGTGILFSGYGPGLKDVNKRNKIYNNELKDVGSLFWHSPGIFIWQSGSNLISSNHIYDQGYSGLLISGVRRRFFDPIFKKMGQGYPYSRWSFPKGGRENLGAIRWDEISLESITEWSSYEPYMHARNNIIEYNEVHDCLKRLHDGNAIYLSAHGNGNIIRKNVTYNHPEGALIRTDDDSHNVAVTENICIGSKEPEAQGLCLKGLNFFENNLLFNSMLLTGSAGNTADIRSSYQKNIVYFSKKDSVFHQRLNMFSENLNKNIYYNPKPKYPGTPLI